MEMSAADGQALRQQIADLERARIGLEGLKKPVAQDDRKAEGREQGGERALIHGPIEKRALQRIA